MTDNPLTQEERYATAAAGAPLINNRLLNVAATALAANNPQHRVVTTLWRLRDSNDAHEWKPAVEELARITQQFILRRYKTRAPMRECTQVAETFLLWYVFPNCTRCHGSGHPPHPEQPQIRLDTPCPHCEGTGHKSIRHSLKSVDTPQLQDALLWLHDCVKEREHAVSVKARLNSTS